MKPCLLTNPCSATVFLLVVAGCQHTCVMEAEKQNRLWKAHDMSRPRPPVVEPGPEMPPVGPPAEAVVLFDGTDLSSWTNEEGGPVGWQVRDGVMEIVPGAGGIKTCEGFGDAFLHLEWRAPDPPHGAGQDRGNSGVFLMERYEIQVLDSYQADTYADGQAGAIYGQYPPRFNVCRPPGQWQTFDISFRRPRFSPEGQLLEPARMTVLHNGILIQDNEILHGPTSWLKHLPYQAHEDRASLALQDHGSPVGYRNIWLLPMPELAAPDVAYAQADRPVPMTARQLDPYTGIYDRPDSAAPITITRQGKRLLADFHWRPGALELLPLSPSEFALKETDGRLVFRLDPQGLPVGLTFKLGGAEMPARKRMP